MNVSISTKDYSVVTFPLELSQFCALIAQPNVVDMGLRGFPLSICTFWWERRRNQAQQLPSIAHSTDLQLNCLTKQSSKEDKHPAFWLDNCGDVIFFSYNLCVWDPKEIHPWPPGLKNRQQLIWKLWAAHTCNTKYWTSPFYKPCLVSRIEHWVEFQILPCSHSLPCF